MYCIGGLLTLTLQFGAKIFQLGRTAIKDWQVQAISSSPSFFSSDLQGSSNWTWQFIRLISIFKLIIIDEVSALLVDLGFSGLW